jgi:hypothetical protein
MKGTKMKKAIKLFKSMDFYPEWEKEYREQHQGLSPDPFLSHTCEGEFILNAFAWEYTSKGFDFWDKMNEVWFTTRIEKALKELKDDN